MTSFLLTAVLSFNGVDQKSEPTFDEKVATAREKAIDYLKKQKSTNGNWERHLLNTLAGMEGGVTALVTLSLLEAGMPTNDPAVAKAVEYLVKVEPKRTYVVSLQTQVLSRLNEKKYKAQIQKNVDWLLEEAIRKEDMLLGWSYPGSELSDGSNTHFAVVALHAAAKAGAKVDAAIWDRIRQLYVRTQTPTGWGYYSEQTFSGERATMSMTTCALIGLTIATKHDANTKGPDPAFEKGMSHLFKLDSGGKSSGYDRFATAELGRMLGESTFKSAKMTRLWFREGAEKLIKEQQPDGSFSDKGGIDANPILSTAFALYFLGPPPKK